jgi:hypothetical protein
VFWLHKYEVVDRLSVEPEMIIPTNVVVMLVLTVSADVMSNSLNEADEDNDGDEMLVMERQTAEEDGRQLQVRHISNVIMMFVAGKQVREAFTSYTSLPRHLSTCEAMF